MVKKVCFAIFFDLEHTGTYKYISILANFFLFLSLLEMESLLWYFLLRLFYIIPPFCFSVKSSVRTVATGRVAGSSAAVSAALATPWTDAAAVRPAGQAGGLSSPPGRNFGDGS